jgi:hypothetical protein
MSNISAITDDTLTCIEFVIVDRRPIFERHSHFASSLLLQCPRYVTDHTDATTVAQEILHRKLAGRCNPTAGYASKA